MVHSRVVPQKLTLMVKLLKCDFWREFNFLKVDLCQKLMEYLLKWSNFDQFPEKCFLMPFRVNCSPFYVKGVSLGYVGLSQNLKDLKDASSAQFFASSAQFFSGASSAQFFSGNSDGKRRNRQPEGCQPTS